MKKLKNNQHTLSLSKVWADVVFLPPDEESDEGKNANKHSSDENDQINIVFFFFFFLFTHEVDENCFTSGPFESIVASEWE